MPNLFTHVIFWNRLWRSFNNKISFILEQAAAIIETEDIASTEVECDTEVEEIEQPEAAPERKQNPTDSEIEDYYEHEQEHLELWERKREKVS